MGHGIPQTLGISVKEIMFCFELEPAIFSVLGRV